MRPRETVLGVVVLGLVLAGVYWARHGFQPPAGATAGRAASLPPTAGHSADDGALADVTVADGVVDLGDVRITLSVTPRPPVALQAKHFRVRAETGSAPVALEDGRISFEMKMPMGDHRYTLIPGDDGWYDAAVILPFCKSGNPRWYAIVEGRVAGRPVRVRFRFDLSKPGAAS